MLLIQSFVPQRQTNKSFIINDQTQTHSQNRDSTRKTMTMTMTTNYIIILLLLDTYHYYYCFSDCNVARKASFPAVAETYVPRPPRPRPRLLRVLAAACSVALVLGTATDCFFLEVLNIGGTTGARFFTSISLSLP